MGIDHGLFKLSQIWQNSAWLLFFHQSGLRAINVHRQPVHPIGRLDVGKVIGRDVEVVIGATQLKLLRCKAEILSTWLVATHFINTENTLLREDVLKGLKVLLYQLQIGVSKDIQLKAIIAQLL